MTAGTTQVAPVSYDTSTGTPGGSPDYRYPSAGTRSPVEYPADSGDGYGLVADEYGNYSQGGQEQSAFQRYLPWILGGVAIIGGALLIRQMNKSKK
jgi:hypothetical protein